MASTPLTHLGKWQKLLQTISARLYNVPPYGLELLAAEDILFINRVQFLRSANFAHNFQISFELQVQCLSTYFTVSELDAAPGSFGYEFLTV